MKVEESFEVIINLFLIDITNSKFNYEAVLFKKS